MAVTVRPLKDRMTVCFEAKVHFSAGKVFGQPARWFGRQCVGPTGKPYTLLCLGVEAPLGGCDEWARVDRRGRVYWNKATANEGWFPIEDEE